MLIGREGDHDLIAGGALDFDDLVALIIDRLHACVASAGLRAHLRYGGRGRQGEQDGERARDHGRARTAPAGSGSAVLTGTDSGSRSEEHTAELQSLMRISYAGICLKKKKTK